MTIRKILWATDGSKESEYALKYAELLASKWVAKLVGLNVIQPVDTAGLELSADVKKELSAAKLGQEKKRLEGMRRALDGLKIKGSELDVRVEVGMPDEQILRVAQKEKVDLIIMGKRGLGVIGRMLIGSTTQKVLRKGSVPVLVVKDRPQVGPLEVRRVLVPLDISEKLDSALIYAMELADKIKASLAVLFVLRLESYAYEIPSGVLTEDLMSVLEYLMKHASVKLSKRVGDASRKLGILNSDSGRVEIKTEVLNGLSPAVSVADYASKQGIDLIVINTHGRKGVRRLVLGSVTEKVIQESPCPVLVLKP